MKQPLTATRKARRKKAAERHHARMKEKRRVLIENAKARSGKRE